VSVEFANINVLLWLHAAGRVAARLFTRLKGSFADSQNMLDNNAER